MKLKIKSLVYPLVTILYWVFNATYRIVDDSYMMEYDYAPDPIKAADKEREMFEKRIKELVKRRRPHREEGDPQH